MCTHALMSPWTKVSLDIKCPWTILDKSLLGQMSPWTKISLDKSLLGQKSLGQTSLGQKSPWTKVSRGEYFTKFPDNNRGKVSSKCQGLGKSLST